MGKRLDCFLLTTTLLVATLVFVGIYIFVYRSTLSLIEKNNTYFAEAIAKETFNDMFQLMSKGWKREELLEFLKGVRSAHEDMKMEVNIFRGNKVKALFGSIEEPPRDPYVIEAFETGKKIVRESGNLLYYTYPLKARKECLRCHINAKVGDVLGVIEIKHDVAPIISELKKEIAIVGLYLIPIPLIGAGIVAFVFNRRIERSLKKLNESIDQLESVSDLSTIEVNKIDFGFEEINRIGESIGRLVDRLRNIAVDRDILEFELKLLEKSVITSEAITDWKDFFKTILDDVSQILDYVYFMVVSREENETYNVNIFWACNCYKDEAYKKELERQIVNSLQSMKFCSIRASVNFEHISLSKVKDVSECDLGEIHLFTKRLSLKKPNIDVIVGMGVSSGEVMREVKEHAVEALLVALLNALGSIKAVSKYTEKLEYFAARDPLTGLYNQRMFWELFQYEVERAKRHDYKFSLLIIDLDNFKLINDFYGHNFGDQVLKHIADILENVFRDEDVVARYGGDEFAIILPYTGSEEAKKVAARLSKALEQFSIEAPNGKPVKVTSSIGIAVFPDHGTDARELFILADSMLYKAKEAGKNRFVIPAEEDLQEVEQGLANRSLFILERTGELKIVPYFQPILNLRSGKTEGYEVLMRVEHEGGTFPTMDFIYTAERLASIHKIELSLIEKALEEISGKDCEPLLFFNLSPKVLIVEEFLSSVREIIRNHNIDFSRIVFEITERETVRSFEVLRKFGAELKREGFNLAVDDFGSGFASFTYIKMLPIDFIKIDGDFIRSMLSSEVDRSFVSSTVLMAKTLKIKTVAEFVESEEILKAVMDMDIDYAQGFYIGEPKQGVCGDNSPSLENLLKA